MFKTLVVVTCRYKDFMKDCPDGILRQEVSATPYMCVRACMRVCMHACVCDPPVIAVNPL